MDAAIERLVSPITDHVVVEPHPDVLAVARPWAADAGRKASVASRTASKASREVRENASVVAEASEHANSEAAPKASSPPEAATPAVCSTVGSAGRVRVVAGTWQQALPDFADGSFDSVTHALPLVMP